MPDQLNAADGLAQLAHAKRATRPINAPAADDCANDASGTVSPAAMSPVQFGPVQFGLRTLFLLVAALCGLFAVMHFIGFVWSTILVWVLLLIIAHVTANFWGTRVAPRACKHPADETEAPGKVGPRVSVARGAVRLSESLRPGWPMFVATSLGAITGGSLGGTALALLSLDRAGYAGVVVGTVSAAAVGGFLGFLTSSFAEIALRAWKEAVAGVRDD
ncbi:MAG TPA: hypothetical protein VFI31_19235 [Pirellulales bacterium]|nr:hypothetical protein [Pirellulales bacterium]